MGKIEKFEDLTIWKDAFEFCIWLNQLVNSTDLKQDFSLRNQIEASAGSVMDNIAEGFERQGNKEFIRFLFIAKGSLGEVRSQLYRLKVKGYISDSVFTEKTDSLIITGKKINRLISYLKESEHKGWHFKEDHESYE